MLYERKITEYCTIIFFCFLLTLFLLFLYLLNPDDEFEGVQLGPGGHYVYN
jgi:hypothetical protein